MQQFMRGYLLDKALSLFCSRRHIFQTNQGGEGRVQDLPHCPVETVPATDVRHVWNVRFSDKEIQ